MSISQATSRYYSILERCKKSQQLGYKGKKKKNELKIPDLIKSLTEV